MIGRDDSLKFLGKSSKIPQKFLGKSSKIPQKFLGKSSKSIRFISVYTLCTIDAMERKIFRKLLEWKDDSSKKALLLMGARQIGKTYILKKFAKSEYKSFVYFNLEDDRNLHELFKSEDISADKLLDTLSFLSDNKLVRQIGDNPGRDPGMHPCLFLPEGFGRGWQIRHHSIRIPSGSSHRRSAKAVAYGVCEFLPDASHGFRGVSVGIGTVT